MKIAISTDTSCTISRELAEKLSINVFPLNVIIDGEEYLDGVTINQDELCKAMRGGRIIKTSTPPPSQIIDYFQKLFQEGYDQIIHFCISSKLSSMSQLFSDISKSDFDNKVIVIDSYSVCSNMLSHVLYAYDELQKGHDIETIVEGIEKRKKAGFISFVPENLTALKNGGRISPAIAALGNLIGLKPVLLLKDGGLEKDAMTRNVKKALCEQIHNLKDDFPYKDYDYSMVSFDGNESLVTALQNEFKAVFKDIEVPVLPIAINVCAHCGPGTVGIIVSPKINEHSLNEYLNSVKE